MGGTTLRAPHFSKNPSGAEKYCDQITNHNAGSVSESSGQKTGRKVRLGMRVKAAGREMRRPTLGCAAHKLSSFVFIE